MDDPVDGDGDFPDFDPTMASLESEGGGASVPGSSGGRLGGSSRGQPVGEDEVREQDRYLPVANIARIMKRVLPANEKITKEAKEAVQECVSEFISFITSEASDRCQQEKRKTINGEDLLWAMGTLGFDDYSPPLKNYLSKFRQAAKKPEGASASNAASSGSVVATPKRDNKSEEAAPWAPALHAMYTIGTQGSAAAAEHASSSSSSSFSPPATTSAPISAPALAGPTSTGGAFDSQSHQTVNPVTHSSPAAVQPSSTAAPLAASSPAPPAPAAAAAPVSSSSALPPTPAQLAAQAQVQKVLEQQALQRTTAASPRAEGPTQREMDLEKQREKQVAAAAQVQAALEAEAAKKKTATAKRPREE